MSILCQGIDCPACQEEAIHCNTCGWNGEGEHIIEPGDCHRIDYLQDRPTPDRADDGSGVK